MKKLFHAIVAVDAANCLLLHRLTECVTCVHVYVDVENSITIIISFDLLMSVVVVARSKLQCF